MDKKKQQPSFFKELKTLARTVDKQTETLKQEYTKTNRQFCYPVVHSKINELRKVAKPLCVCLNIQTLTIKHFILDRFIKVQRCIELYHRYR